MIDHEKSENLRTIFENDSFIAFVYYAARFPFETWILPKKHQSHFEDIEDNEKDDLIKICRQVFGQLDAVLSNPPLNFFIHSAPLKEGDMPSYHWHMEIAPRLANYGGFEMGSGVIIDIINPESAADYLRMGQRAK
jgi:UDPglucose--hexose-1-phosphate uridylyltransferase